MLDDTVAKANTHHYAKLSSIVQTVTEMPQFFNHDLTRLVRNIVPVSQIVADI